MSTLCTCPNPMDSHISYKHAAPSQHGQNSGCFAPKQVAPLAPSSLKRSSADGEDSKKSSPTTEHHSSPPLTGLHRHTISVTFVSRHTTPRQMASLNALTAQSATRSSKPATATSPSGPLSRITSSGPIASRPRSPQVTPLTTWRTASSPCFHLI